MTSWSVTSGVNHVDDAAGPSVLATDHVAHGKYAVHFHGKGNVPNDDLIDNLISKAQEEVASRHAEVSSEEQRKVATQIAIGALRYFLLKFTRNSVIAFDLQEALSFEGETGPYVQYAAVRARNVIACRTNRGRRHGRRHPTR